MREIDITKAIIDKHIEELNKCLCSDVVIVGAGPSGLVAGSILAQKGYTITIFEKRLAPGGGIWGGGMGFKYVIIQKEALDIVEEFNIPYEKYSDDLYAVDAINFASGLILEAGKRGVHIFNLIAVEDLLVREGRVQGVVINNTFAKMNQFPIDPLTIEAKAVVDATGHEHEVVKTLSQKNDVTLNTPTGKPLGERSLFAETAEKAVVTNTKEVYPGLYVCGMATAAVYGGYRMGPIFGGMLMSGKKLAGLLEEALKA
ncbi:Ribose 1,5-bisphosphate or 5-ribose-1,2-cyclic phosphate dehydrogenase [Dissulfuribacter thermophilus]|uniref:Thiamine thiazole synthase n=1 Tax=Dissulfuribacter thermophilus TaxID=1156395 RepID=A0A1B9F4P1_9BACT|nr:sulfide-dependent adenosine diphosphate thiazole synthase [Dissulfuribacter thermophilus]OCC14917.1 Ribose 1,5-bisphosphate or 5-ribose-1,2-cyclic phosphate dehydrogenase [Dissulfuribacter thermophilus]